jgi:uncharacterized protein YndB with AHSA1/START domain
MARAARVTKAAPTAVVHLTRRIAAPREQVFRAWTEPELLRQWFTAPGGYTPHADMDVRVGGSYRIEFRRPLGFGWTTYVVGTFLEVSPPERLVYTFAWERPPPPALGMGDSRVTVEFTDLDGATEVSLTHERLDQRRLRVFHRFGWHHSLHALSTLLEARS